VELRGARLARDLVQGERRAHVQPDESLRAADLRPVELRLLRFPFSRHALI
jgi:hypothetical protein